MSQIQNPIFHAWQWWFTPRSTDPTVVYRERALRYLLPIITILRIIAIVSNYSGGPELPIPYFPLWVAIAVYFIPILFSIIFLVKQEIDWAGVCFLLQWYLTDMISLPIDGYWHPGFQISLIIQIILATLLLPGRAILPFYLFQIITVTFWGYWLDVNYFDAPLLSSGESVATFEATIITLAVQEAIILFIVRYLRLEMEKSLRLQQASILELQTQIRERLRLQVEREKFVQELEQRNSELERLAYTLSHELKSPLITVRGFLGFLHADALNGNMNRLEIDIQRISEGTEKMVRLINELIDLMSVGRITHEFKEMPLHDLADEAVELVRERIAQRNIVVHIADDLPRVYGDHKLLVEILQNLLENSAKFMGKQPEPKIEIGQRLEQGGTPIFYVSDNGIGIDPRFHDRIFGIFHKLDVQSEGTGIGLAIVKRIIEVHGGRIWVESEGIGKGTTFCFTIPDGRASAS